MIKKLKIAFLQWLLKDVHLQPIPNSGFDKYEKKRLSKQQKLELKREKNRIYMREYTKRKKKSFIPEGWRIKETTKTTYPIQSKSEKKRLYYTKYNQRPDVIAKRHEYYKKWYANKKLTKEKKAINDEFNKIANQKDLLV